LGLFFFIRLLEIGTADFLFTTLAIAFGLPLYLLMREIHLSKQQELA